MKKLVVLSIFLFSPIFLFGEEESTWEFNASWSFYFFSDLTYLNPIISADRNRLHLEARYNYEDFDTGSVFAGYNFHTGETVELSITPMIGGVFGDSTGIAPAFQFELSFNKFGVTSEGEYFFSSDEKESNFFYSWSEISYSPAEWIWFGIAGQRTRAFETDLEIQRGPFIGFGKGNFAVTGYVMNPGYDDVFGLISMEYQF